MTFGLPGSLLRPPHCHQPVAFELKCSEMRQASLKRNVGLVSSERAAEGIEDEGLESSISGLGTLL